MRAADCATDGWNLRRSVQDDRGRVREGTHRSVGGRHHHLRSYRSTLSTTGGEPDCAAPRQQAASEAGAARRRGVAHRSPSGGLAARTIGHAHRVLGKALRDAEKDNLVIKNVCKLERAPKVTDEEMVIVRDVAALLVKLRHWRLGPVAMVALFTGMRLSEVLALRWNCVDLDAKVIRVREALEQTKAHGIRFKSAKTRAGRRDITLPDILVDALREHRKRQLEFRMQIGAGRLLDDALLFATIEGDPLTPNGVSMAWSDFADDAGISDVTFHALRHTHASQLIDAGVDIVTISKRLGHSKPDITLRVYAHLFRKGDGKAAEAINRVAKW